MSAAFVNRLDTAKLREFQVPLDRFSKKFDQLFWDLLMMGFPNPYEGPVIDYLIKYCSNNLKITKDRILKDAYGNLWVTVGDGGETMFCAHVDTVHRRPTKVVPCIIEGCGNPDNDGMIFGSELMYYAYWQVTKGPLEFTSLPPMLSTQLDEKLKKFHEHKTGTVVYHKIENSAEPDLYEIHLKKYTNDPNKIVLDGWVLKKTLDKDNPQLEPCVLGADDKVGVWLLLQLMRAKVKGTYVFHLGEECGRLGSSWIAKNKAEELKKFKRAIAFDRNGYKDVIGYQCSGQCCSREFADKLAKLLTKGAGVPTITYLPMVHGSYTDTASYVDIIPECTNISCAYFDAHTSSEHFDWEYLRNCLLPTVLEMDWEALPTKRDPTKKPSYNYSGYSGYGGYGGGHRRNEYGRSHWGGVDLGDEYEDMYGYGMGSYDPSRDPDRNVMGPNRQAVAREKRRIKVETSLPVIIRFAAAHTDKFWTDQKLVAPWNVTDSTPEAMLPWWKPEYGLYPNTSTKVMLRIIKRHLTDCESPATKKMMPTDSNTPEKIILRLTEFLVSQRSVIESLER